MMEEHIGKCPECQALLAEYKRLDEFVAAKSELGGDDYWEAAAQKIETRLGFPEDTPTKVTDIKKPRNGLGWKIVGIAASVALLTFIGIHQSDIMQSVPGEYGAPSLAPVPDMKKIDPVESERQEQDMVSGEDEVADEITIDATPQDGPEPSDDQDDEILSEELTRSVESKPAGAARVTAEEPKYRAPSETAAKSDEGQVDVVMFQRFESAVDISVTAEAPRIIMDDVSPTTESVGVVFGAGETEVPRKKSIDGVVLNGPAVVSAAQDQTDKVAVHPSATGDTTVDSGEIFIRGGRAGEVGYIIDYYSWPGKGGINLQPGYELPEDTLGIAHWRSVRDSLKAQLKPRTKRSSAALPTNSLAAPSETFPPEAEERRLENQRDYFEAVYMVAKLTEDTDEYYRSLNILSAYLEQFEAPLRDVVKGYIKELEE